MSYHVPFAHRNRHLGPIYIGFDQPVSIQKRKRKFNWAGFFGLMLALISPLTLFLAAPVALLFCLFGMRRAPRGMAVVGGVLALGGTTILSLFLIGAAHENAERQHARQMRMSAIANQELIEETGETMDLVRSELRAYRTSNDNWLPGLQDGMMITVQFQDGWDRELFYEPVDDGCAIRSAGPDGEFLTGDDIVSEMAGIPGPRPIE